MQIKSIVKAALLTLLMAGTFHLAKAIEPANPNATPEARALLDLFQRISGKYTLTGQHNYPATRDQNSRFAANYIGQTPAIWSTDMGFAREGDTDSYLARPDIVKEAIRQHKKGSIITICWHAVPPTADEPVTFQPRGPVAPDSLASVQGKLPDAQFKEIQTPGTRLYNRWAAQVDSIAKYLKQLQDAHVPVLWRPYHEMNGDWFWWGGRVGENSTIDMYRQIYDRLVNYHKINNLVWIWSVDRPSTPVRAFSNFYPGNEYLDILALDVYGSDFKKEYYDGLKALSKGKPIVLGEVGNPPAPDILTEQPDWAYWVIWAGMAKNTSKKEYQTLTNDPRILSQEDPAYQEVMAPFRKACGLPLLPLKNSYLADFTGQWKYNEEKSETARGGFGGNSAYRMDIDQDFDRMFIKRFSVMEYGNDQIANEEILLDGTEMKTVFYNSPRISKAAWNETNKSLKINTSSQFNRGGTVTEMNSSEEWSLTDGGKTLKITQISTGFQGGENKTTLVFEKQE